MEIRETCEDLTCTQEVQAPSGAWLHCTDRCIVPELRALWTLGVETLCSCYGHGMDEKAYIRVKPEWAPLMLKMGYEPYEPHRCLFHPDAPAFRARTVRHWREQGKPELTMTAEEIRRLWRIGAGLEEEATA